MLKKFYIFLILNSVLFITFSKEFKEKKSEHFIVYYEPEVDEYYVDRIISKAELNYRRITEEFRLVRDKLWLWGNRANIYIAKDKDNYLNKFKCPDWSGGCVNYRDKIIYTFKEQNNIDYILVHELTHIIFREYVGENKLPLWLDEGMAMYVEYKYMGKPSDIDIIVKNAIKNKEYIKFADFSKITYFDLINKPKDYVNLFYSQSYSIINYLIDKYSMDNFKQFLYFLKNGYKLEEALKKSFYYFDSLEKLEEFWIKNFL